MENKLEPRSGQLERRLSQRIETLYRTQLGHQPEQVTCQILDKKIAIFIDDSITQPEQLLTISGQPQLAEQVRSNINREMKSLLKALIEEVVQVPVLDVLIDSAIATGCTSTIVILATAPKAQEPLISPELKQQSGWEGDSGES